MTSTLIIPNEAMLSVPIPSSYIGKEVEVTYTLVNGTSKTAFREQQILEPDDDLRRAITMDELRDKIVTHIHELYAKSESNSDARSI